MTPPLEVSKQIRVASPGADQRVWNATGFPYVSNTPNRLGELMQGAMSATPAFAGQSDWAVRSIRSRAEPVVKGLLWAQTGPCAKTPPINAASVQAACARKFLLKNVINADKSPAQY
jgi:hypothetical protein